MFRRRLLSRRNYDRRWAGRDDLIERQARNLECAGLTALLVRSSAFTRVLNLLRFRLKANSKQSKTASSRRTPKTTFRSFPINSRDRQHALLRLRESFPSI